MDVDPAADHPANLPTSVSDPATEPEGNGSSRAEENKFQKAIAAWRSMDLGNLKFGARADELTDIDLTSLIPNLDSAASDLVAHQRDALIQRKDLAQKTKDFRKVDDTVKLGEVKGLLKGLQSPRIGESKANVLQPTKLTLTLSRTSPKPFIPHFYKCTRP